jgi:hypothetical protein
MCRGGFLVISLWTAKAGSGATVTAAALAIEQANAQPTLLVDLGGDVPAVFGLEDQTTGLTDWLDASGAAHDALARLEVETCVAGLSVLPMGNCRSWDLDRGALLAALLGHERREVIVDVGHIESLSAEALSGEPLMALRSTFATLANSALVTRCCYLSLRRALALNIRPQSIVVIREGGRHLDRTDCEELLGAPVVAEIDVDPAVARAVDRGRLTGRSPRSLFRQVRPLLP